jgi:formate dehydrogenase alpha subunit
MPESVIASVCPYCGAGCGFYIKVEKDRATGIEYMTGHPASEGALCSKGNAALEILYHQDRLGFPLKRKGEGWARIAWDEALELVARGLREAIKIHGSDSIGFLASSKCTNEENYLIEKLARCLGSPNVDNCARLCHAPTVIGLNRALGAAGMTNPIADLANSECIFIIGSNLAENHPILSRWIHRAKDAGAAVIVVDPRLTHTAWMADIFLQIKPGTDVALLNGMACVIIREGLVDPNFISKLTTGYENLVKTITAYTPERVAAITGVSASDIVKASRAYAKSSASAIVYSMGITQHTTGTDNVQALSNLALICGHVGKQGAGIFPLRGQNNVQGACDMGALAEFYPGYRKADDPDTTKAFSQAWGIEFLPLGRGLTATEMIDAAIDGKIKAMYIVGEDPANSDPNSSHTCEALKNLDFLVVQDIFMTATAQLADIVLPASAWAEKEGTYTSTERRVQWSNKAIKPPNEAKADLAIICEVAGKLGLQFMYPDASAVLSEINRLVPAYGGITRNRLTAESLTWPCPSVDQLGTPILHSQGFKLPGGKATIVPIEYKPPAEESSLEYPFILTTGRVAVHHNAGSMTRRSPSLLERELDLFVEINAADAARLSISEGEEIVVTTPRGKTIAFSRVTNRVGKGVVFMPFHFPETNILTSDVRDAEAKIPEFKISICKIARGC